MPVWHNPFSPDSFRCGSSSPALHAHAGVSENNLYNGYSFHTAAGVQPAPAALGNQVVPVRSAAFCCGRCLWLFLTELPERIEIRRIVSEGGALVAEGRYDEAINEYRKLGELGRQDKMQEKIAQAEEEKQAALNLERGKQLLSQGNKEAALQVLESIPEHTRAGHEAVKLIAAINRGIHSMVTLEQVKASEIVQQYLKMGNQFIGNIGAIEHNIQHAEQTSQLCRHILTTLGYSEKEAELGAIAGYLHDIGNLVNRYGHGMSGALMAFKILLDLNMDPEDIATIMGAIGNHEEQAGGIVSTMLLRL